MRNFLSFLAINTLFILFVLEALNLNGLLSAFDTETIIGGVLLMTLFSYAFWLIDCQEQTK